MNRFLTWITVNDTYVFHYVNQQLKCNVLDVIMPKVTHLGSATFTLSSLFLAIVMFEETVRSLAITALFSLTISHLAVVFTKRFSSRERPYSKLVNVNLCTAPLKDYSFPSGHTAAAFSVAVVFMTYSLALTLVFLPAAVLTGISRMYLGVHYPTDCLAGALIGTFSALITVYIASPI